MRRWALALVAALALAGVTGACGSNDNGGVIQGPVTTTAPGATTTAGGGGTPGY